MDNIHNNGTMAVEHDSLSLIHYVMVWTLCSVSIIAFVEHFVILLLTCVNKTLRQKPYIVSILLLSSSDILLSIALFLFTLITLAPLRQTWICGFAYFLIQLGFVTSLVHTLAICTERYLCSKPIPMEAFSLGKRRALALINIGICSLILGIPYLFAVKESTVKPCILSSVFRDNLAYALVPVRSVTFLIWVITILIYIITAKNFRNSVRRTGRMERGDCMDNKCPNALKPADNLQSDSDTSRQFSSTSGLISNRDGYRLSTEIEKQIRRDEAKVRDASTKKSEDHTLISTSTLDDELHSVPENKLQANESIAESSAHLQRMGVKAEDVWTENKTMEDAIKMAFPVSLNKAEHLTGKSAKTSTCVCSVKCTRYKNTKLRSQAQTEAFRIVSVVFVVFLISMTPQSVVGPVMIFFPMSDTVEFGCAISAILSILTNPIMFALLLKDFRKVVMKCK